MAKGWVQAVLLVGIFGFTVLGYMAARTYQKENRPADAPQITQSGIYEVMGQA